MRIVADILILLGAPILTLGFDLVIVGRDSPVGGPLGVIASLIGSMLLTGGILQHYRLAVRARSEDRKGEDVATASRTGKTSDPR
jgi:hypothetical protein